MKVLHETLLTAADDAATDSQEIYRVKNVAFIRNGTKLFV